jgi:signal peptidase I
MKNKHIYISILILFIWLIFYFFYLQSKNNHEIILEKTISWFSMEPLIKSWEKVKLIVWFYDYNDIKRWDLVAYDFAWKKDLFIKQVRVLPWDNLIIKDKKLYINNEVMKNSIWNEYIFSPWEQKLLNLYIINWKLKKDVYFIFWDNIINSIDSRRFWWVSKVDIVGKFERK